MAPRVGMRQRTDPGRFAVLVYDGVEPIDLGGTVGVLSMARRILPNLAYTVLAEQSGPVRLAGGLTILADAGVHDAPPRDVTIVTGGPGWSEQRADGALIAFLRREPPERLASVCTGRCFWPRPASSREGGRRRAAWRSAAR
jgi:transcriptional regulator GlxA family with amidase domain